MNSSTGNLQYFASIPPEDTSQLADAIKQKIRSWRVWCGSYGLTSLWTKKLANYYGTSSGGNSSQQVNSGGAEGELYLAKVNDLHSLIQEQLVTVTSQRPAGVARAINSDTDSLKSAKIGTAIAEYYMSQANFESSYIEATEIALLCDEGFTELFWDKNAGDPIAVDHETGKPEMSGDCIVRVHPPWNVARDPDIKISEQKWYIISFRQNKYDLAAMYPKFKDQILIVSGDTNLPSTPMTQISEDSDAIYAHLLVHDRTPACENGRYSLLIGDAIVLDTALPFKDFPVDRIAPSDVIDGSIGYAPANDIMGLEQITDALHSIITSNEVVFGGQNIVGPQGAGLHVNDIAKGLRYFELPPDLVPLLRPLELCRTPAEVFNYIGLLGQKKERAVGSVASALAQQASQGASGSSMALIQTQSISFNSGTQRGYFRLMSSSMTKLIGILRVYADSPRVARIVGKSKASGLKEFKYTGEDLNSISSIVYEMVNPIAQTFGGRLQFAQDLLKAGQIKSPKQYINVATTGQVEVLTQDDESDGMLILEENEALSDGRPVIAVITEMHADHIKSHNSLITQEAKENDPALVQAVTNHVMEHIQLWMQASATNPAILIATGQQPLPPPPPPMPPPGMMPPQPGSPSGGPSGPPQLIGGGDSPAISKAAQIQEPKSPELPTIAGTKDQKPVVPGVTTP